MRKTTSLAIFTIMILSGCCTVPPPPDPHVKLTFPEKPRLPKIDREVLDCGSHNPETLPLCRWIVKREALLKDHIETMEALTKTHNEALDDG